MTKQRGGGSKTKAAAAGPIGDPWFLVPPSRRQRGADFSRPAEQHAWVASAMGVVVNNFASLPFVVKRGPKRAQAKPPEDAETDPLSRLLANPNPLMTGQQFLQAIAGWGWMTGEVCLVCEGDGPDGRLPVGGMPTSIWPINGRLFRPLLPEGGKSDIPEGWELRVGGRTTPYKNHELVWIRTWNPYDPLRGLGRMEAALSGARQDFKASIWSESFFDQGAVLGGVIGLDFDSKKEARDAMRETFNDSHRGVDKAHRVLVLQKGMTFTPAQAMQRDMEFLKQRTWNREEVLAALGVPPILVMLTTDYTRATASAAKAAFLSNTLLPFASFFETTFSDQIRLKWEGCQDAWLACELSAIPELNELRTEQVAMARELWGMGVPFNEINERLQLGMKKTTAGGTGFLPYTVVPADLVSEGQTFPVKPQLLDPQAPGNSNAPPAGQAPEMAPPPSAAPSPAPPPPAPAPSKGAAARAKLGKEMLRRAMLPSWELYVEQVLRRPEIGMTKGIRRHFWNLREVVLDGIRAHYGSRASGSGKGKHRLTPGALAKILWNEAEWDRQIRAITAPFYEDVASAALSHLADETGVAVLTVRDPKIATVLKQRDLLIVNINRTLEEQLREALIGASAEAMTNAEAQAAVIEAAKGQFANANARALTIARTELGTASAQVRFEGMKDQASRPGSQLRKHRWLTAGDAHVRMAHMEVDGEIVEIGQPFGNGLLFPGEYGAPPEQVINCRCIAVAVFE